MITVVGIGADGWDGLAEPGRRALRDARVILGAERQLALLPADLSADRRPWPSPMADVVDQVAAGALGDVTVLASGNPMLHGIGATLARKAGADQVQVIQHPSSFALACARMGWAEHEAELVSVVARPPETVGAALQRGRRVVALVTGTDGAAGVARVLMAHGCGDSPLTVLEHLGGPDERRTDLAARDAADHVADPLHVVAFTVTGGPGHPRTPGLPDDAYINDGQLTKRHVRALTVVALGPLPGEHLWDVGAGAGSIAIEWLRAEPTVTATAIESVVGRAEHINANALALGVPQLTVVTGGAPAAFDGLPVPDVIFIGGGITGDGLLEAAWEALRPGGRVVANTVTLEGEHVVMRARERWGGTLTRIGLAHAEPVGGFTGWRPAMPVTQWVVTKP